MQIPESYLELGLTALAHSGYKTWFTGHYGAALLAAYFMDQENDLPEHVQAGLMANCNHLQAEHSDFFVPFQEEDPDPKLIDELVQALKANLVNLRSSGHGVILGVLAMKAINKRPDLCVPAIVKGLSQTLQNTLNDRINRYYGIENYYNLTADDIFGIPRYQTMSDMIEVAFAECEFAAPNQKVGDNYYFFTGELEHGVTFAHALVELKKLGYDELVTVGMETHRLQMYCNRQRPGEVFKEIITEPTVSSIADQAYWSKTYDDPHSIKVPYAAFGLLQHISGDKRIRAEFYVCKVLSQMK